MKKTFIIIFTSLIFTHFVGAQTIEQDFPDDRLGIRGGYNFSKIDSDLGANTVRRKSIHAGIFYQYNLSNNFALQPELQYSSEGWIKESGSGDTEAKLHFANITLVGKFFLLKGLNFQAGIQPALLIDGSEEGVGTFAIDERLKRFNLGAVFGIGYDFGFGLRLGGRYVQGLIDINDGYNASSTSNEIKTTTFQVYVGYSFALSKSDERTRYEQ
jgi:hypothetical protein